MQARKPSFLFLVLALGLLAAFPLSADLVDFTGLTGAGGTFSTSIAGDPVVDVSISPLTQVNADGSFLESAFAGAGLRQVTQNSGGGFDTGDQSSFTVTLAQPEIFTLSTGSGASAADERDILRISPVGVAPGGADFWVVSGTANIIVSEDTNHVLTLMGTGPTSTFMSYTVQPGAPLASFSVTHESATSGPTLNSHIFDVDVPLLSNSVLDIPVLDTLGIVALTLLLLSLGIVFLQRIRTVS